MISPALFILHLSLAQADILPPTPVPRGEISEDPPPPDLPPNPRPTEQIALGIGLLLLAGGGIIWHRKNQ